MYSTVKMQMQIAYTLYPEVGSDKGKGERQLTSTINSQHPKTNTPQSGTTINDSQTRQSLVSTRQRALGIRQPISNNYH
jgi:hypothetical protein